MWGRDHCCDRIVRIGCQFMTLLVVVVVAGWFELNDIVVFNQPRHDSKIGGVK